MTRTRTKLTKKERRLNTHALVTGAIIAVLAAGIFITGSGIVQKQAGRIIDKVESAHRNTRAKLAGVRSDLRDSRDELRHANREHAKLLRFLRKKGIDIPGTLSGAPSGGGEGPAVGPHPGPGPGPKPGPNPDPEPEPNPEPEPEPEPPDPEPPLVCDLAPVLCDL